MSKAIVLYGASGHSKVIIDILKLNNFKVLKIIDDDISKKELLSHPIKHNYDFLNSNKLCFIGIGNNLVRKKIALKYVDLKYATLVHPKAIIDNTVTLNYGTVIMAGTIINSSTIIGRHCIVNTSASIDHDCKIEDFVHISPNVTLCGNVTVSEGSHIGAGSVVIQGVTIGRNVIIGAGSVIINDIEDNCTVVGNPAKIIKKHSI